MRFLLDENIHHGLIAVLTGLGHDIKLSPKGVTNGAVFDLAVSESRVLFTHDTEKYCLERELTLEQQRLDSKKTDLVLEVNKDGMPIKERHPQQRIQALMPFGISEFLFFNGERIDHLAMEESATLITDAIRQMLLSGQVAMFLTLPLLALTLWLRKQGYTFAASNALTALFCFRVVGCEGLGLASRFDSDLS